MIQVSGNKKERITQDDLKVGLHRILKDGELWFHASGALCPIVWNNIIGANFEDKTEHEKYCQRQSVSSGNYTFVSEHSAFQSKPFTEIDSCIIKVNS